MLIQSGGYNRSFHIGCSMWNNYIGFRITNVTNFSCRTGIMLHYSSKGIVAVFMVITLFNSKTFSTMLCKVNYSVVCCWLINWEGKYDIDLLYNITDSFVKWYNCTSNGVSVAWYAGRYASWAEMLHIFITMNVMSSILVYIN